MGGQQLLCAAINHCPASNAAWPGLVNSRHHSGVPRANNFYACGVSDTLQFAKMPFECASFHNSMMSRVLPNVMKNMTLMTIL
jgi:hypothetical protein